ncbi:hypothetical protein TOT_030000366 [Theileria orientalis strain Shintoku]|uniref:Phosphatidate cytidylyltransferase n=1 Tax=Theileria orientalis strain Shintoku TaxID=869250 RepID=J4C8N6_THEOR|nr:hypothetical protein TOT_030000366 [Theileria orientalis strain Shintoku]PVC54402.1 hypothetical protein MACL_00003110 [Theileria orientalis]BAM41103.1 hypothetical protein TOT_030000366 [Theileria orientalis strain Shintoku]|eukprot:XP_009691404.1 hypothetical protein TOT_030000366 [Theileria orientalis strain Shintoku]
MIHLVPIFAIFLIAYSNVLNKFYSRKLVHLGCGLVMAKINYPNVPLKYVILTIAAVSVLVSFVRPFPFGNKNDIGIISYNLTIIAFILMNLPIRILLPMFVVDPMASIVGCNIKSPVWIHTKTVFGSLACFFFSMITLYYVNNIYHRLILSVILTLTEGLLEYSDNVGIIFTLTTYYFLATKYNYPIDLDFKLL